MASASVHPVIRFIRRLTEPDPAVEPGDGTLLDRFAARRDEAAFAALLQRHGPMVYGVCRRVLGDSHDADDAYQATFLVLVRKAGSIARPELLGNWLYGVAFRTALKARGGAARHRAELQPLPEVAVADPTEELVWRDLRPVLDEELSRLPDKYRTAVVLCDLEGRTHEEAARSLGCPRETVTTRLTRARARLRSRLLRRGLTLSAGLLTTVLAERAAPGAPPAGLADPTLRAALRFAAGQAAAGVVSPQVAALTGGVLQAMFWNHLMRVAAVLVAAGVLATGAGLVTYRALARGEGPGEAENAAREAPAKPAEAAAGDRDRLQGAWKVVSSEWMGSPMQKRVGMIWVFAGEHIAVERGDLKAEYTYQIDPAASPKHLDLTPTDRSETGYHYRGIYRLDRDRLTLCARVVKKDERDEKVRPTTFTTQAGDQQMLLVLERQAPPGKPDKAEADREKLQGTWVSVSAERDGARFPEGGFPGSRITFRGDEVLFSPTGSSTRITYRLDPAQKPRLLTMTAQDGPDKGRGVPCIYEFDGDRLKLCWDTKDGKKWPTAFAAPADSGLMLLVLRREQPADKQGADGTTEPQAPTAAPETKPEQTRTDRDKMQGTWAAVSIERGGRKAPGGQIKGFTVAIKGNRLTFNPDTENRASTFTLDPSKSPREIDLVPQDGPAKGQTVPGIYELEGDVLKLCGDNREAGERPREFATSEGTDRFVMVLKRTAEKPAPEDAIPPATGEVREDWDNLQGTWTATAAERDGQKVPEEALREIRILFRGSRIIIRPSGEPTRVSFRLDPTRSPKVLAMTAQEGPDRGKTVPGIYDLRGDRLKLCIAEKPGGTAPAEFATREASGLMLLVLKREPDEARRDREKLQGTWQAVSGEGNGQPLADGYVKSYKATFTGDRVKLTADDSGEGTYTLDPTQKPKAIDFRVSDGPGGRTAEAIGIYEVEGDTLKLCMVEARDGNQRPTEFAARGKEVLLVFQRTKADKK
jgi:RNA polymerase sigma factor (sigma-70 family)